MNRKKIIIAVSAIFFALLLYYLISITRLTRKSMQALNYYVPSTYELTSEDSGLIAKKYMDSIKTIEIVRSKMHDPVSLLKFDDKFGLTIYKITQPTDAPLQNSFKLRNGSSDLTNGTVYDLVYSANYQLFFKSVAGTPGPIINLNVIGDSIIPVAINDSLISYHLLCSDWSVKYTDKDTLDIIGKLTDNLPGKPKLVQTNILFLKKHRTIYFLLLSAYDPGVAIPLDMLNKITGN